MLNKFVRTKKKSKYANFGKNNQNFQIILINLIMIYLKQFQKNSVN